MINPWLQIPADEYEGHMSQPHVDQLLFLSNIFMGSIRQFDPKNIAVLGAATGKGLEHISDQNVTVYDINPEYLARIRAQYNRKIKNLNFVEGDLGQIDSLSGEYDLIFAGLIFEYLNPKRLLSKISTALKNNGVLLAILQLPSDKHGQISETKYKSIEQLEKIMHLVNPIELKTHAKDVGLSENQSEIIEHKSGKCFYKGTFSKIITIT